MRQDYKVTMSKHRGSADFGDQQHKLMKKYCHTAKQIANIKILNNYIS